MEKHNILTPAQIAFLETIGKETFFAENFYLSGGTPLAAFYLGHRYSEDLDFFSEKEFDPLVIDVFLKKAKNKLGILSIDFQQSYNRNMFFCHTKEGILKTEFTYFPFPRIENGERRYNVIIDSLLDIAVNKLFTIYQRTKARDYIDLFFIIRENGFSIPELIKKAKLKFDWHIDPIQLGAQFIAVNDAKDYPRMIQPLNETELKNFFIAEAQKFKNDIFE